MVMGKGVAALYLLISLATLLCYAFDKRAAVKRQRRISERTLHGLALLGGWPGALLAQRLLRHKTRKASFQRVFWLTVLLNLGVLASATWLILAR